MSSRFTPAAPAGGHAPCTAGGSTEFDFDTPAVTPWRLIFNFWVRSLTGLHEGLERRQGGCGVGCRGLVSIVTHALLTNPACDLPLARPEQVFERQRCRWPA